jgi:hypothetical protein
MVRTVLIVDDHPSFRSTARMLLEDAGYVVVGEAADGAAGLRAARSSGPDVVLLDVNLPRRRRVRRRGAADRRPGRRAGRGPRLQPRRPRLRPAGQPQRGAGSSPRPTSAARRSRSWSREGACVARCSSWVRSAWWSIAACVWLTLSSNHLEAAGIDAAIVGTVIATYIGTGLFAWWRRPGNRVGLLMVLVGFAFSLGTLQTANASLPFTLGISLSTLYLAVAVHMLFAFPHGHITSRLHRRLVAAVYVLSVAVPTTFVLFSPDCGCPAPGEHPDNAFLIVDSPATAQAIDLVGSLLGIGVIASIVVVLVRRLGRATSAGGRRAMTPVLWTGALMTGSSPSARPSTSPPTAAVRPRSPTWSRWRPSPRCPSRSSTGLVRSRTGERGR